MTTTHPAFSRAKGAFDLELLHGSRVVIVGAGGSAAFMESLARCGVGEMVIIDNDRIEMHNIASQGHSHMDIGQLKVLSAATRVQRASPVITVVTVPHSTDELTDSQLEDLCFERFPGRPAPLVTLLVAATDSFTAQARIAHLGLEFGVATLAGQVYKDGVGVEVAFSAPGHSPACIRCALGPRYRDIEKNGIPQITSHGVPSTSTVRLNSLEIYVAIALLHGMAGARENAGGDRWLRIFDRIKDRNLVQVRCVPDTPPGMGSLVKALEGADPLRVIVDESVWLLQEPERRPELPDCLDCGGRGDLLDRDGLPDQGEIEIIRNPGTRVPRTGAPSPEFTPPSEPAGRSNKRPSAKAAALMGGVLTGIVIAVGVGVYQSAATAVPSRPVPATAHVAVPASPTPAASPRPPSAPRQPSTRRGRTTTTVAPRGHIRSL